jgi:hypothetical protein
MTSRHEPQAEFAATPHSTLPLKGGGGLFFPPPLRGRVREGGEAQELTMEAGASDNVAHPIRLFLHAP